MLILFISNKLICLYDVSTLLACTKCVKFDNFIPTESHSEAQKCTLTQVRPLLQNTSISEQLGRVPTEVEIREEITSSSSKPSPGAFGTSTW